MIIDDKLDWSGHIEKVTKKVVSGIGAIRRMMRLVPQATLRVIYETLIQPHFDYCYKNYKTLENLKNRAARVLTYSSYDVHAGHLFKLLRSALHGLAPEYPIVLNSRGEKAHIS